MMQRMMKKVTRKKRRRKLIEKDEGKYDDGHNFGWYVDWCLEQHRNLRGRTCLLKAFQWPEWIH